MNTNLIEKVLDLKNQIDYHDDLFFNQNSSEISDSEYDLLKVQYLDMIENNPELLRELEALQGESKGVALFEEQTLLNVIEHNRPFFSLRRTYDFNQVGFYKKLFKDWYIETKLDGLAIELIYAFGKLKHVVTKGTFNKGEDVTHNARLFKSLPEYIKGAEDLPVFDIRCEAHLTFDDIAQLKDSGVKINKQRNQVSGWIRSQEPTRSAKGMLTLSAYEVSPEAIKHFGFKKGKEVREWLKTQNFAVPDLLTEKQLLDHERNKLAPFDGYIMKANNLDYRLHVDGRNSEPVSSIAFKYNTLFGDTEVIEIDWCVNKNQIVPRLYYKEVNIDNSKCSYANLFNAGNVLRLGLGFEDKVRIVMGGDCVPHLNEVITKSSHPRFRLPDECPCCKGPVSKIGPTLVCNNTTGCTAKLLTDLKKAVSKEGLDIKGLGVNTLKEWVGRGFVKKPLDLYHLDVEQIGERYYNIIQSSRRVTLSRFIYVLGIDEFGLTNSQELSKYCGNVEKFLEIIDGKIPVQPIFKLSKALAMMRVIANKEEVSYINRFALALHIRPDSFMEQTIPIVITGSFDSPRNVMAELLLKSGIEVVPRVNKNVKCVIVGYRDNDAETGSMKEAAKLKIPLIFVNKDTEFNQIIKDIKAL